MSSLDGAAAVLAGQDDVVGDSIKEDEGEPGSFDRQKLSMVRGAGCRIGTGFSSYQGLLVETQSCMPEIAWAWYWCAPNALGRG